MEMQENIEILNLLQQKEEETIWCQNQIIIQSFFTEHLLVIEMKKPQIFINKPANLGHSILELRKILIYQFWYDCSYHDKI